MGEGSPKRRFACVCCRKRADDEYHWWTDDGQEIVWNLCEDCCEFAHDIVEFVSEIDNPQERETW